MSTVSQWLAEDNHRIILVDMQYHDGTALKEVNFASHPYIMRSKETYVNTLGVSVSDIAYDDIISTIPTIESKIDASITIGNMDLQNSDGEYDWLMNSDIAFEGHKVKVYLGDPAWFRSQFILILDGVVETFNSPTMNRINISISDRRKELDVDIQDTNITTTTITSVINSSTSFSGNIVNADTSIFNTWPQSLVIPESSIDKVMPILLGSCFNIEPVMIDSSNHIFMISNTPITSVSEVRSNGVVLDAPGSPTPQYEVDANIGCIRLLNHDRATRITCDAIGVSTRHSTADLNYSLSSQSASQLIEWIILDKTNFNSSDICYNTFSSYANTAVLGIYITDSSKIIDIINNLVNSVGGYLRFTKITAASTCSIQIQQLVLPTINSTTVLDINADNIVRGGLSLSLIEQPNTEIELGYQKNWTLQEKSSLAGLLTTTPSTDKLNLVDKYANEYSVVESINSISVKFPLAKPSDRVDTLIYNKVDAQAEADRRAIIRSKKRYVYKVNSEASPFTMNVGDIVNIKHIRYNFTGRMDPTNINESVPGRNCLVIGLKEKPTKKRVELEVWL